MSDALSPKGIARAKRLALMLAESGVSQAYSSDAKRTHATLSPLKEKLGDALVITEASAAAPGGPTAHVQEIVAAISALPAAAVAIVVSHSNTVGPIIAGLGGGAIASIAETEFDKLFISQARQVVRRRWC